MKRWKENQRQEWKKADKEQMMHEPDSFHTWCLDGPKCIFGGVEGGSFFFFFLNPPSGLDPVSPLRMPRYFSMLCLSVGDQKTGMFSVDHSAGCVEDCYRWTFEMDEHPVWRASKWYQWKERSQELGWFKLRFSHFCQSSIMEPGALVGFLVVPHYHTECVQGLLLCSSSDLCCGLMDVCLLFSSLWAARIWRRSWRI